MQLTVSLLPSVRPVSSSTEVAVVIDVLRATSVMTTALANGAQQFVTCPSIDEARELSRELSSSLPSGTLLCGERHCKPIDGFDLGNSPAEYVSEVVQGRTLILTTTNGTLAIAAAQNAKAMIAASFLNLSAVARRLQSVRSAHLVCAGTNGQVTAEDVLLAGAIVDRLSGQPGVDLVGDETILARELWSAWMGQVSGRPNEHLAERLTQSQGGRNLSVLGYHADLRFCADVDRYNVIPERICKAPATFGLIGQVN
jgi:2-phosphosulfolactate phosphatase